MKNRLIAIAGGRIMGEVRYEGGRLDFHYDPSWSDDASAFPMSLSMPLVVQEHGHTKAEAFLWGLLPDNEVVLQRWGQKFRIFPRNPFRLIENVGEDCAGAIQFAKPDRVEHLLGLIFPRKSVEGLFLYSGLWLWGDSKSSGDL